MKTEITVTRPKYSSNIFWEKVGKHFLKDFFSAQTTLRFYFNEDEVTVNAQKQYFQEQLTGNEILKYKKILASIVGSV